MYTLSQGGWQVKITCIPYLRGVAGENYLYTLSQGVAGEITCIPYLRGWEVKLLVYPISGGQVKLLVYPISG
ncbi:hypothetical protein EBB07_09170 [Paenibacillaceae bacterium]|nr:hypothetical protein EBB07_09170 [Paenibacillaceae bacterium]